MRHLMPKVLACLLLAVSGFAHAEDGVTDTTIRIGQTVGVTGQIAGAVREMNQGAFAYINSINRQGGVHGRRIEVITLDDKFDPALSGVNARKLLTEDRVFALFQNRGTPHTQAILPLLEQYKVPLVAPSTGAAILHTPVNPYVFNVRTKYQAEVIKAVEHFNLIGIKRIALAHVDDSFGKDALEGFNTAMTANKLEPSAIVSFDREKPDLKAVVASLIKAQPHTVIIVSSATTGAAVINSLRQEGSRMQVMTLSNNSSEAFIKSLGDNAAGVIVMQITPPPGLMTSRLGQELKELGKHDEVTMSYSAMEGLVAAKVMVEGLKRAGRNLTRDGYMRALSSIKSLDLGGITVSYGPDDHTGSEFVEPTIIGRNGKFLR